MEKSRSLTSGNVFKSLLYFAIPVFFSLFLQALYGGADLLIVGRFAGTNDVSGVASGSLLLQTVTNIVTGLSMGITILVGEKIGERKPQEAGKVIGSGICLFAVVGVILMVIMITLTAPIANVLHTPKEAFAQTCAYIRICGGGALFIVAYNVLSAIFRGIGDSRTPLITVLIACITNIVADLVLVGVFGMGAAGAAIATVFAQALSVVISLVIISRKELPFVMKKCDVHFNKNIVLKELKLGTPVGLQEFLVGTSFLVIQAIVNSFGVTASAGVGVAEKVCVFIMLIPSAYMQSMSAFTAQNMGAGKPERARKALFTGIITAFIVGVVMAWLAFFHGNLISSIFSKDAGVITEAHSYLKAYGIDCMLTPFLFCMTGYFNGCEKTLFVMIQGLVGAFCVRIPIAYVVSRISGATLFQIGLATPSSSAVQIVLCLGMLVYMRRKRKNIGGIRI